MLLGAIVGDVLHNLRSALDSIAWETCQRSGVSPEREKDVYFPIGTNPTAWPALAGSQLPTVDERHVEVFRQLQPWFHDQMARDFGIDVPASSAVRHPLYRLHELARTDRHRIPHPVLARAGHTWLGTGEAVKAAVVSHKWNAKPGEILIEWRIDPASAVLDAQPEGEAILVFNEDAARHGRSALHELQAIQQAVTQALRRIEIEVLEIVSPAQIAGLEALRSRLGEAQTELESLRGQQHVIDSEYVERYKSLAGNVELANEQYAARWRELFE
jgi:hypothetical protein